MVIVRVSYGYGYTRGSGRVRVAILGTGRVRVRVSTAATGTGRVAKMVDPHTSRLHGRITAVYAVYSTVYTARRVHRPKQHVHGRDYATGRVHSRKRPCTLADTALTRPCIGRVHMYTCIGSYTRHGRVHTGRVHGP